MSLVADRPLVYYACGGGLGHVTRAAAILRQLRRRSDVPLLCLTNCPRPLPLDHEGLPYRRLEGSAAPELAAEVAQALGELTPRLLVVDVFPTGVVGELSEVLPSLACPRVLVHRHVREERGAAWAETRARYDLALVAEEEGAPLPCPTVSCGPILLRDAEELLSRAEAREVLGVAEGMPVVLGVSTEPGEWTGQFFALLRKATARVCPGAALRLAHPEGGGSGAETVRHYPLLELLNGVDVVVGPAGYNLYHEARACGVPAVFLPRERRYDDQAWRARESRVAETPEALEGLLREVLSEGTRERPAAVYENGAGRAAEALAALLSQLSR